MGFYVCTVAPASGEGRSAVRLTTKRDSGEARHPTKAAIAIALSVALLIAPMVYAAEPLLTLPEALKIAASDSRQLAAQDAAVGTVGCGRGTRADLSA